MLVLSTDTWLASATPLALPSVARVLLADDDLASRLTIKIILSTAGYSVDGVATASEAIDHLAGK